MSAQKIPLGKRMVAALGTVAVAFMALFGAGAAAHAAPAGPGNIDFEKTDGSIIVHKHAQPNPAGDPADGSDLGVIDNPLEGVEFTVQKVENIDLSDETQWAQLQDLTAADIDPADLETPGSTLVTRADGTAEFTDLEVGVYYVTEGEDTGNNNIVRKVDPFLVIIPTAIDGEWEYTVHVYPKNSLTEVTKTLNEDADDAAEGAGDIISWDITSTAPVLAPEDEFTELRLVDTLDERLMFESITEVTYGGAALEEADYEVTSSTNADGADVVTFELTEAGLAKVAANDGQQLAYALNTSVREGADIGNGVIENEVTQYTTINEQEFDFTTPPTITNWGYVNIFKQDADNQLGLGDAEFQIFRTEAEAADPANSDPIAVHGQTTFTTDENGELVIGPLNAGAENLREYWVVETKAPAGYQLDQTPQPVDVSAGANAELVYTLDNVKQPDFELPLTGSTGTMVFLGAGLLLLMSGGGLYLRNRARSAA
ncbi:MAG TPA: SpaH/EbpB family LPXTG-anchored major pilin [Enteractinococcus helveticum]|uniref:SpaH/EbpB family LPXTG-anchored major pilin n=1 Tax=Enteractinococcus helveticum TaxID=1837282 RepID=A0A921K825_9MICC|nr:SpaH/EbpB family LPXTG-anchored major pilin [Enteractinococcus helveticum]HJF15500.1 SpaH/EbpB family LPXTG-anchored major pilin [Enteractinococcus helveticum]